MRVFACFLYFSSLKKDEITQVCVRLFYSLHIQQWMRNHWKGQRTVAVIPFSDVGILNPEISCALLSHHLVNSCRLAHNFSAAWSMGSKESGLIPVLLYHVPVGSTPSFLNTIKVYFIIKVIVLQHFFILFELPENPTNVSISTIKSFISSCHINVTFKQNKNICEYFSLSCLEYEHKLYSTNPNLNKSSLI